MPILTYKQIMNSDVSMLKDLYKENNFLPKLKKDWDSEVNRLLNDAIVPEQVPHLEVITNATYKIYGIIHSYASGSKYTNMVNNELKSDDLWLCEDMLNIYFDCKNCTEIPDNISVSGIDMFVFISSEVGLKFPFHAAYLFSEYTSLKKTENNDLKSLGMPLESCTEDIPAHISLELKEINKKPYDFIEHRSAYQTVWLENFKKGKNKSILVGGLHVPQIEYFLNNGIKNNEVIDKALMHVDLLETDPDKYLWAIRKERILKTIIPAVSALPIPIFFWSKSAEYLLDAILK